MSALLTAALIVFYSLQPLLQKLFNDRYTGRPELAPSVFCIIEGPVIALVTLAFSGFRVTFSLPTLLIGILNALALYIYNTSLLQASALGSYAFMNVSLLFGGIIVPMIYSIFVLNDVPTIWQFAAIAAMLVSFVLMNHDALRSRGARLKYYICCGLLFLSNGVYCTLIKVQSVVCGAESTEMIIVTYIIMSIVALVQLFSREGKAAPKAFLLDKRSLLPFAAFLLLAALCINGLVFVMPMVNAVVFYTVESGGVLLLGVLYSIFFFHEKPSPIKLAGIILAVLSITAFSL